MKAVFQRIAGGVPARCRWAGIMCQLSSQGDRIPPEIVRRSIWPNARFTLSFRDVEEMLAERGPEVSHETIRRWLPKLGTTIAATLLRWRPGPSDHWHLDEIDDVDERLRLDRIEISRLT